MLRSPLPLAAFLTLAFAVPAFAAEPEAGPTPGRPDGEGQVRSALPRARIAILVPGLSQAGEAVTPALRPRLEAAVRTMFQAQRPTLAVTGVALDDTWQALRVMAAEGGRRVCKEGWRLPGRVTAREGAGSATEWRVQLQRDGAEDRVGLTIEGPTR